MGKHRTKEEKLKRLRRGSRYVGLDLNQFDWECLKLEAAAEELTETDILRRIVRTWSEGLPAVLQEKAREETARLEAWKANMLRAREKAKLQVDRRARENVKLQKQARLKVSRAKRGRNGRPGPSRPGVGHREGFARVTGEAPI